MNVKDVVDALGFKVVSGEESLQNEVTGGYCSDLLSHVMANCQAGNIWITIQSHLNVVAVASLTEASAIVLAKGVEPEGKMLKKAEDESIPVLSTDMSPFEICGRLYKMGISREDSNE